MYLGAQELHQVPAVAPELGEHLSLEMFEKNADCLGVKIMPPFFINREVLRFDDLQIQYLDHEAINSATERFLQVADERLIVIPVTMENAEVRIQTASAQQNIQTRKQEGVGKIEQTVIGIVPFPLQPVSAVKGGIFTQLIDKRKDVAGRQPFKSTNGLDT